MLAAYLPVLIAAIVALLAMEGVFQAALFKYVTTGEISSDYPEHFIRHAWERQRAEPLPNLPSGMTSAADAFEEIEWPDRPRVARSYEIEAFDRHRAGSFM